MVISFKDIFKLIGIIIMMGCASIFSTLFINYSIDLSKISDLIEVGKMQALYDAQIMSGKVIILTAGSCLIITTFIMLLFYIKFYIDNHKSELGILKALGYSNFKISIGFYKFGISVLIGTLLGFIIGHLMMGYYYDVQLKDGILPMFSPSFNIELFLLIVILPTILFSLISIIYAYFKLKVPALDLIKGKINYKIKKKNKSDNLPFLDSIRKSTIREKKSLAFFMGFSVFCFSAMMQMSTGIGKMADPLLAWMIFGIGLIISIVIMLLSMSTLMMMQRKNIGLMRVFGYQMEECKKNVIDCYRKIIYISFILGTIYQFGILKMIVLLVFKNSNAPDVTFNVKALIITLISFILLYELLLYYYKSKIKKLPIKEIMLEAN